MKILYVITKSNFGGAQRYVHELATELSDQHEVAVVCGLPAQTGNNSTLLIEKLHRDNIRTIPVPGLARDINPFKELLAVYELWRIYRDECPDVIHLNSSKALVLGALAGKLAGVPHIVSTVHGWPFLERRNPLWRAVAWTGSWVSALLADNLILVSEHDAQQRMPFCHHKTTVIHTAVPTITFLERGRAREELFAPGIPEQHRDDLWLVTSAELTGNKNIQTAIDAVGVYNATHDQRVFYTIIGDGELQATLTSYIEEHNLTDQITLLGYTDNARTYLHAFDIFLLPSYKEGLPYALLEAGAAGIPVIASNVGGIPEIITGGTTGILIDPDELQTISDALHILANPTMRARYGGALTRTIAADFSLTRMVERTRLLYQPQRS